MSKAQSTTTALTLKPSRRPPLAPTLSIAPHFAEHNVAGGVFPPFIPQKKIAAEHFEEVRLRAVAILSEVLLQRTRHGMKNTICRQNMASQLWHWRKGEFHSHPQQSFYRILHSIDQQQRTPLELEAIVLGVSQAELFDRHMLHLFGLGGYHKELSLSLASRIQKKTALKTKNNSHGSAEAEPSRESL